MYSRQLGSARRDGKSIGRVISDLARTALTSAASPPAKRKAIYGLRPFPTRGGVVTTELIDQLREGDAC
jgi:hypothetical protein